MAIRVLICDDHGILRAGLQSMLTAEPGIEVVGEASSSDEAIRQALLLKPDIVLMDISMPGAGGMEVTRELRKLLQNVRVIILTVHDDRELLKEAIRVGASGYVIKRAAKAELFNAIQAAMQGDFYVHPSMTRALLGTSPLSMPKKEEEQADGPEQTLTRRETEVLKLIVQGYTNPQIADELKISVRTVEFHRANLMAKLNLDSRVALVRYAADHGLLTDQPPGKK